MKKIDSLHVEGVCARARFPLAAVALAAATLTQSVAAQEVKLATTVVTAARSETKLDETLADVRVITEAKISNSAGRSLAEVLQRFGGVQMASNGGRGNTQDISIRGSKQVILLVDGVRFGSATLGSLALESLPLENIERIEIVHGPASALYGSNAIGGVIQIFTKNGQGAGKVFQPQAGVTWGSKGYKDGNAGFTGVQNQWDYALNVSRLLDPGFSSVNAKDTYHYDADIDKFNQTSVNAAIGYKFNTDWRFDAKLLRANSYAEADSGGLNNPNFQSDKNKAEVSSLKVAGNLNSNFFTELQLSRGDNKNWNSSYNNIYKTRQDEFKWNNRLKTGLGLVIFGYERLEQEVQSTVKYKVSQRDVDALYAGWNGVRGANSWQVNLRRDENSQFGGFNTWGVNYGYEWVQGLRTYISRARSLNAPTFNQLYYPSSGNENLVPEAALNSELGLDMDVMGGKLRAARFDSKITNMLSGWPAVNIGQARKKGWSMAYSKAYGTWFVSTSYEHLDAHDGKTGQRLTDRLAEHQATMSVDKTIGAWKLGSNALYVGKRTDSSGSLPLKQYITVDAYAEYKLSKDWAMQARVANLTDKQYETAYGYNQRGRAGFVTLKWTPR